MFVRYLFRNFDTHMTGSSGQGSWLTCIKTRTAFVTTLISYSMLKIFCMGGFWHLIVTCFQSRATLHRSTPNGNNREPEPEWEHPVARTGNVHPATLNRNERLVICEWIYEFITNFNCQKKRFIREQVKDSYTINLKNCTSTKFWFARLRWFLLVSRSEFIPVCIRRCLWSLDDHTLKLFPGVSYRKRIPYES